MKRCPKCEARNDVSARACLACGEPLDASDPEVAPGLLFADRYEILSALGRGGMGMVYKAHDRHLGETVALKILRPDLAREAGLSERFRSEIRLARRIRHKNVCSIFGDGEHQGVLYICMELVEGIDLKRMVRERGMPSLDRAYGIAMQAVEGLAAIHEVGIIHRDLKAANIMEDDKGVVRLMDFGLAKRSQAEDSVGVTATGHVIGTPEYMSPEQARGEKLGVESDIYGLGIVIYELFTGQVPFKGDTPLTTLLKHLNEPPPLSGPKAARLPGPLVPVLRKALAKDPRDRYRSALELREALLACRAGVASDTGATPPRPQGPSDRALKRATEGATVAGTAELSAPTENLSEVAAPTAGARSSTFPASLAVRRRATWFLAFAGVAVVTIVSGVLLSRPGSAPSVPSPSPVVPTVSLSVGNPPPLAAVPAAAPSGTAVLIGHEPIGCLIAGAFPLISAVIRPEANVSPVRVFFSALGGDDNYYVDMIKEEGRFVGKLPRPKLATVAVSYYIAAYAGGARSYEVGRTARFSAIVASAASTCPTGARVADTGGAGEVTVFSSVGSDLVLSLKDAFGLEDLLAVLKDPDARVRERAAASFGQIGPLASQAIGAAAQDLKTRDPDVRERAASDLGVTGRRLLRQVTAELVDLLSDKNPAVRKAAAEALGEIGPSLAAAVSALRTALKDPDAEVRTTATDALGSMGYVLSSALAALEAVYDNDKDARVGKAADDALEKIRRKAP